MKKVIVILVFAIIVSLLIAPYSARVHASRNSIDPVNIQITTNAQYDRDPSVFKATDDIYWLFFARGKGTGRIRGVDGYDPDLDYYDIYYKTAASPSGLAAAAETKIPLTPPDNAQRDISALQSMDGTIWVFTSTGLGQGADRSIYYYTFDGTWHGPAIVPLTDYAAHISVLEYSGKIWVFFDIGYSLYLVSYDETAAEWSTTTAHIVDNATIAKAIVDGGTFYVVWTYVNGVDIWGSGIYLSTSSDGTAWVTNRNPIAVWNAVGATNWDPVLVKDGDLFRLYWAPDIGSGGQILATTTSYAPTDETSWSTPVQLTISSFEEKNWWDFWPQPYVDDVTYLFYTSERNPAATDRMDGNIWMMLIVPDMYLPMVFN